LLEKQPKALKTDDSQKTDVSVITPNPKTSGEMELPVYGDMLEQNTERSEGKSL
jgi:ABC-type sulfate transport system substrate-binding protein